MANVTNDYVVSIGEVLFDCLPSGGKVLGGAPCNVLWHLCGFGVETDFITAVGADESGVDIVNKLSAWGVGLGSLQKKNNVPSGAVNVEFDGHEPRYDIVHPVAYDFLSIDLKIPDLDNDVIVYHGSLVARSKSSRLAIEEFVRVAKLKNVRRFFDVNLRAPWFDLEFVRRSMEQAHTVKMNVLEFEQITESKWKNDESMSSKLEMVRQSYSIVNLIVTLGKQGAVLIDETGERYWQKVPEANLPVVSTVGAGDAFSAVVILGMLKGWDWPKTLERAQQFASFIVTKGGAVVESKDAYSDFATLWGVGIAA